MNTISKILLVDDHEIIRTGLRTLLKDVIPHSIVNEAWDRDSALGEIGKDEYDLIILDVNIPGTDSVGLVIDILALKPKASILMFSMNADEIYAKRYLNLGVKGYINKHAPTSEVILAIKTVLGNKKYISPVLKEMLLDEISGKNPTNPFKNLSTREFQIFQHLIRGKSSAEIISTLQLNSSTVGTYKARIFKKLKCKNVFELNVLAKVHNILPD